MVIVEAPSFSEDIQRLLDDESYADLQAHLVRNPLSGDLIQETGGAAQGAMERQG